MQLQIEHHCPQCGGPNQLSETSRSLCCSFCGVQLIILGLQQAAYTLPCRQAGGELYWFPYLRLKGNLYSLTENRLDQQLVDTSLRGLTIQGLPASLGFRPQAMTLQRITSTSPGIFLAPTLTEQEGLHSAGQLRQEMKGQQSSQLQAWIGEAVNTLFQPVLRHDDRFVDGITGQIIPLQVSPSQLAEMAIHPVKELTLLPSICPNCGWDMASQRRAVVYFCANCQSAWQPSDNGLRAVTFSWRASKAEDCQHLPFWRLQVTGEQPDLQTFADFARLTNLPMAVQPHWQQQRLALYCPAFHLPAKVFLRVASQATVAQLPESSTGALPWQILPATLPAHEAIQALPLIIGESSIAKRNVLPILADLRLTVDEQQLLLLPFFDNGYELCQEERKIVINKQQLGLEG